MKKRTVLIALAVVVAVGLIVLIGGTEKAPYSGYDFDKYVKVADYKSLTYKKINVSVTDDEVKAEILKRREAAVEMVSVKEGVVENGDVINVAYEGKIDGKTFEGGSSDSFDITVGTTSMIDGFVEGLIGKKVGETVTLDLKFPEDYGHEDLNGKDVVFTVTINTKAVEQVPEYDLAFVKNNSDCNSLEEYEKSVKEDLLSEKREEKESEVQGILWEKIVEDSEVIQYPKEKDELIERTLQTFRTAAANSGKEWTVYLEEMGYTEDTLLEEITAYAEKKIYQELIIYAIADKEGLEVTNKEYKSYMMGVLTQSGYDEVTFQQYYGISIEDYCEQEGLRASMLLNKVMDKVMEYAKEK